MQGIHRAGYILAACLIVAGLVLISGCTQQVQDSTIVKTDAGFVSGINQSGIQVYLGIPFAAPPVGDLRWRPPAPVTPWEGVKAVTEYGATCPQAQKGSEPSLPGVPALNMSEDCLYLNVWTPTQNASARLPVMVFFYGGGFTGVEGSMPMYNGTTLAEKGVIVVTTNYRLGALGFLAHPDLDRESPHNASGNYGILDQQAALKWVQDNIVAFGGDPSRVTIFGQSAGTESVYIHLVSPGSRGLFSQAIVESGPFWANGAIINATHPKDYAEQFGVGYAQSLGCSGLDAIACMRNLSPDALITATPSSPSEFWIPIPSCSSPTLTGGSSRTPWTTCTSITRRRRSP